MRDLMIGDYITVPLFGNPQPKAQFIQIEKTVRGDEEISTLRYLSGFIEHQIYVNKAMIDRLVPNQNLELHEFLGLKREGTVFMGDTVHTSIEQTPFLFTLLRNRLLVLHASTYHNWIECSFDFARLRDETFSEAFILSKWECSNIEKHVWGS